jgi:hypothetical protein
MSPKGTAKVRSALSGLGAAKGEVSRHLHVRGQYLLEITAASDDKPTRNDDYMLKVEFQILGYPDADKTGGYDPAGKKMYWNGVVQDGEYHDFQVNQLKNLCNAANVKIDKDDQYVGGVKKFLTQIVIANVGVGKNKNTGEDEQKWNGFLARDAKGVREEYAEEE